MLISVYNCIVNFFVTRNSLLEAWTFFLIPALFRVSDKMYLFRGLVSGFLLLNINCCIIVTYAFCFIVCLLGNLSHDSLPLLTEEGTCMPPSLPAQGCFRPVVCFHGVSVSMMLKFGSAEPVCSNVLLLSTYFVSRVKWHLVDFLCAPAERFWRV